MDIKLYNFKESSKKITILDSNFLLKAFDKNEFYLFYNSFFKFQGNEYNIYPLLLNDFQTNQISLPGEDSITMFNFFKKSTIKNFFNSQFVDVPTCFNKSKSLTNLNFERPLIKITNIIMRSGLKNKVFKILGVNFFNFFNKFHKNFFKLDYNHWFYVYLSNNLSPILESNRILDLSLQKTDFFFLKTNNKFFYNGISFNFKASFEVIFLESFEKYFPTFSFYIRKVDKSVRKNSRGKSGKYTIIWKYVPLYKRFYTTIRWFLKDLKFQKSKTFFLRFLKILETFILNPNLSFLVKLRRFVHFYVFENLKNKLMKTLKATS